MKNKLHSLKPLYPTHSISNKYSGEIKTLVNAISSSFLIYLHQNKDVSKKQAINYLENYNISETIIPIFIYALAKNHNTKILRILANKIKVKNSIEFINNDLINKEIKKAIKENIDLIRSIPKKIAEDFEKTIFSNTTELGIDGNSIYEQVLAHIKPNFKELEANLREDQRQRIELGLIKKFKPFKNAHSRAKLIARDQTNKINAKLTEVRHKQLGAYEYIWVGMDDNRERRSHLQNNDEQFEYDNPPITGNPSQAVNCRCVAEAVFTERLDAATLYKNNIIKEIGN